MVGIYFSGTGNSKYAAELFCKEYDKESVAYSIEDREALKRPLEKNRELVKQANQKIKESVKRLKAGDPTQEGIGALYRLSGVLCVIAVSINVLDRHLLFLEKRL
jgi:hypothetical protein